MKLLILSILFALLLPVVSPAAELKAIRDTKLTEILNNIEVLAVADHQKSKGMYARILRLQEHSECDGSPSTCPKSRIYIAVSEYGESPEQKVYRLPLLHNWEFVEWLKLPELTHPTTTYSCDSKPNFLQRIYQRAGG